jgi:hypothetical protein
VISGEKMEDLKQIIKNKWNALESFLKKSSMLHLLEKSYNFMHKHGKIFGLSFALLVSLQLIGIWLQQVLNIRVVIQLWGFIEVMSSFAVAFYLYRHFLKKSFIKTFTQETYISFLKFVVFCIFLKVLGFGLIESMGFIQTQISDITGFIFIPEFLSFLLKITFPMYVIVRFSLFYAVVAINKKINFKAMIEATHENFREWFLVSLVLYTPVIIILDYVNLAFIPIIIKDFLLIYATAFWINYYQNKNLVNLF